MAEMFIAQEQAWWPIIIPLSPSSMSPGGQFITAVVLSAAHRPALVLLPPSLLPHERAVGVGVGERSEDIRGAFLGQPSRSAPRCDSDRARRRWPS